MLFIVPTISVVLSNPLQSVPISFAACYRMYLNKHLFKMVEKISYIEYLWDFVVHILKASIICKSPCGQLHPLFEKRAKVAMLVSILNGDIIKYERDAFQIVLHIHRLYFSARLLIR